MSPAMLPSHKLIIIKALHTIIWAVFAGAIVAIPVLAYVDALSWAWGLCALVLVEVVVLRLNRMRCPLTDIAQNYTTQRADNFDIYLPLWLARHNKSIFGTLFVAGLFYCAVQTFF